MVLAAVARSDEAREKLQFNRLDSHAAYHRWVKENDTILLVPSVLISGTDPRIKNCLLNPEHPGFAHAKFSGPIP
jgi:hypothetical protein